MPCLVIRTVSHALPSGWKVQQSVVKGSWLSLLPSLKQVRQGDQP